MELNAATRLNATEITASYTGTKVGDLYAYIKAMEPSLKLVKASGMTGGSGNKSGQMIGRTTAAKAHALASKLIDDGWYGELRYPKPKSLTPEGRAASKSAPFMMYVNKDDDMKGFPSIKLGKPNDTDGAVRILISHSTAQSNAANSAAFKRRMPYKFSRGL